MPDDLYVSDFVLWSTDQAEKLRRLSQGEQVNDIDWPNVVGEVADLGKAETRAMRSLLARALEHLLKVVAFPAAPDINTWLYEADIFLRDAKLAWSPGMEQLVDLPELYDLACVAVRKLAYREGSAVELPPECPIGLRDLLPEGKRAVADSDSLIDKFRGVTEAPHAQ